MSKMESGAKAHWQSKIDKFNECCKTPFQSRQQPD